ncbi:unnamed protein product [Schistosoma margrebowiei]|uniref:Uncharacterized protein n=1 Tax=Schistosoma margrebowiei TaxID=48269 RepID=A0A183LSL5_9TREM|nr:unnamed protein product [Schistosoma margrebowiei]
MMMPFITQYINYRNVSCLPNGVINGHTILYAQITAKTHKLHA